MNAETERIVYEESARAISEQQRKLESLRTRAGTLLAAAALVAAFLGGPALGGNEPLGWVEWSAIACLAGVLLAALMLLAHRPWTWVFAHDAHSLMDQLLDADPPASEGKVLRHLAYFNELHWRDNDRRMKWMGRFLSGGAVALVAETALWLVVVGGR